MRCQPCYNNACENCDTLTTEPPLSNCTCSCVAYRARVEELERAAETAVQELLYRGHPDPQASKRKTRAEIASDLSAAMAKKEASD